jgi:hypothetical protein
MQRSQRAGHAPVRRRPFFRGCLRHGRVGEYSPFHVLHHVERGADDARVSAQAQGPRHGDGCVFQGGQHSKLALYGMGRGQRGRRGLLPQDKGAAGVDSKEVGGVGLAVREFEGVEGGGGEAGHLAAQIAQQGVLRR